jgi:hypothetical protein
VRRGRHWQSPKRAREEVCLEAGEVRNLEDVLQQVRRKLPVEDLCNVGALIKVAECPGLLKDEVVEAELRREMARRERADPGVMWVALNWAEVVRTIGDQTQEFEAEHEQGLQFMQMIRRAVARAAGRRWGRANGIDVTGVTYDRVARALRDS